MNVEALLEQYAAGKRDFSGINLSESNCVGLNLSEINLQQAILNVVNFTGANLSRANLSQAKLNVARLNGANLSQSNLLGASLNVANLIQAIARRANFRGASFVQAELIRADLSGSTLQDSNLSDADLREAKLRRANLLNVNFKKTDLRGAVLTEAYLGQANLNSANLSRADLRGADLREAEMRHANLVRANLSGANLSGANLRWADLSGANLSGADLSYAKLSGATLVGAVLEDANLLETSFVHSDLTQANLIGADWMGADLTGVTLTAAKLHNVPRFRLTIDDMICDWIDLSPNGDNTQPLQFKSRESIYQFFSQVPPTVQIVIDAVMSTEANYTLAAAYYQLARQGIGLVHPPDIEISRHRTILIFRVNRDEALLSMAYTAIAPFQDADMAQKNIQALAGLSHNQAVARLGEVPSIQAMNRALVQVRDKLRQIDLQPPNLASESVMDFLKMPTQTILTNTQDQSLRIYQNPRFGKRLLEMDETYMKMMALALPQQAIPLDERAVLAFIEGLTHSHPS
jgi:uncharacterized protein YjbI with pentapeptide repeats